MMVYSFWMRILVMSHLVVMKWVCFSVNLNNINLDNNFDEDDPDTIILIRRLAWDSKFKKRRALNKKEK